MPNRIIKESVCISEQIDELSPFEETFFYRLLVNCDDYGCMDAREKVLAAKLYPLRNIRPAEIIKAVNRLADIGLIALYEVDEKPYLKVIKWSDHQRVRISKHKYPEPTEEQIAAGCGKSRQLAASCGETRRVADNRGLNPIQSNPNPNTNPNTNPNPNPNPIRGGENASEERFNAFWMVYPRKESKPAAKRAFLKINPDDELLGKMINSIERWSRSSQWQDNGGQFIPYPASWLNNRKWEDDPPKAAKQGKVVIAQQYEQRDYSDVMDEYYQESAREIAAMKGGEA